MHTKFWAGNLNWIQHASGIVAEFHFLYEVNWKELIEMRCAIWYHLNNLKNVKKPMVECYFLVKLQA